MNCLHAHLVVLVVKAKSLAHAKVADFSVVLIHQKNVTSREISVHVVPALQVRHSLGDLMHQLQNVRHRQPKRHIRRRTFTYRP